MNTVRTIADMRLVVNGARQRGATIGLVPTMGAFHGGHLSLMRRARTQTDFVVVSLFVNPAQFENPSDLMAYPRDEALDAALAEREGVDVLFAPTAETMYPEGFSTGVTVAGLSEPLCGAFRGPAHFRGVATVVTKLFNIVTPDTAFFGQKDAQQAIIVSRLARDLDLGIRVEVCPIVREPDGLAMSSRNVRLGADDRRRALALKLGLDVAEAAIARGGRDGALVAESARAAMRARGLEPEYVEIVSARTLRPVVPLGGKLLVAIAAHVGPVRLIDNVLVDVPAPPPLPR